MSFEIFFGSVGFLCCHFLCTLEFLKNCFSKFLIYIKAYRIIIILIQIKTKLQKKRGENRKIFSNFFESNFLWCDHFDGNLQRKCAWIRPVRCGWGKVEEWMVDQFLCKNFEYHRKKKKDKEKLWKKGDVNFELKVTIFHCCFITEKIRQINIGAKYENICIYRTYRERSSCIFIFFLRDRLKFLDFCDKVNRRCYFSLLFSREKKLFLLFPVICALRIRHCKKIQ